MNHDVLALQEILHRNGFEIARDGIAGPRTRAAAEAWLAGGGAARHPQAIGLPVLPWISQLRAVFGLHELRDNAALRAWLISDGRTLGDPAASPWCGDAVETAIRRGLPKESVPSAPYWARNWQQFGIAVPPVYGALAVFERDGGGGHVGFLVGESASLFYVLGGNQGNEIGVDPLAKSRLLATRWPATVPFRNTPLPAMSGGTISRNEF